MTISFKKVPKKPKALFPTWFWFFKLELQVDTLNPPIFCSVSFFVYATSFWLRKKYDLPISIFFTMNNFFLSPELSLNSFKKQLKLIILGLAFNWREFDQSIFRRIVWASFRVCWLWFFGNDSSIHKIIKNMVRNYWML